MKQALHISCDLTFGEVILFSNLVTNESYNISYFSSGGYKKKSLFCDEFSDSSKYLCELQPRTLSGFGSSINFKLILLFSS